MPAPLIKLCGLTDTAALEAAIAARADYAGFNFFAPSPRFLTAANAVALGHQAEGRIKRVGVFVNATGDAIADMVAAAQLDAIQLHGSENPAQAAALRARFAIPVWKVLSVSGAGDIAHAEMYKGAADFILFDAKTPKGTLPGGMGLRFDWSLLGTYRGALPWGLAGGLSADSVAEAVQRTGAPLVDAASGIESAPGVKDPALIAAFCAAARRA